MEDHVFSTNNFGKSSQVGDFLDGPTVGYLMLFVRMNLKMPTWETSSTDSNEVRGFIAKLVGSHFSYFRLDFLRRRCEVIYLIIEGQSLYLPHP